MSKGDLHKLGKTELLQIIYEQEKQITSLKKEVDELNKKINDRTIELEEAGSIAEASLRINKIFEEAQKAADEYLNSVKKLGQSKPKVTENITNEENNKNTIDDKEVENKELYIDESELEKDKEIVNKDDENDFIDVEFTEVVEEDDSIEKSIPVEKGKELVKVNLEVSTIKKSLIKKLMFLGLMIKEKINVLKLKRDKKRLLNKIKQIGKKEIQDLKRKEAEKRKREKSEARKKALNSLKTFFTKKIKSLNDKIKNYIEEKKKEIEEEKNKLENQKIEKDNNKEISTEKDKPKEKPKRPRGRPKKKRAYSTIKIGYELIPIKLELIVTKKTILTKIKELKSKILEKIRNLKLKREKKRSLYKIKLIGKKETLDLKKKENDLKRQNKINNIKNNLKSIKDIFSKKNKNEQKKEEKKDVKKESKIDKKESKEKKDNKNGKKSGKLFKKKEINLDDYDLSVENIEKELNTRKKKESKVKFARTFTYFGIVVVAFAIIIATRIFNVLQVSGNSMEPTLYPGNLLISTKIFGYEKGDIIAFYYNDSVLIKRIIASEGDIVYIDDLGNVFVNSQQLEEEYVEELAYGNCDITFPYRVPSGELFVLGDNRATSVDSRSKNLGTISEDRVLGKIVININQFTFY